MTAFYLLLKPVGPACNLACDYCFYRRVEELYPQQGVSPMPDALLERLIAEFLSYRFSISVFCWQGGEPTLAGLDFFQRVVALQQLHGVPGQVVGNSLQTNGILIDDHWGEFLARYSFLVGLSLDGPPQMHDIYRRTHSRAGSSQAALRAASVLRRHGVCVTILAVVHQANQAYGREVYSWLRDQGFDQLQFIPCVERDEQGRVRNFSASGGGYGEFLCDVFEAWWGDAPGQAGVRMFDSLAECLGNGEHSMCDFKPQCGNYLLLERNGDVYPCDFYVRRKWRLGNLMEGPLAQFLELPAHRAFVAQKTSLAPLCQECEWLHLCYGGCPKDRFLSDSRSYLCAGYRQFFEHAVPRLQTLVDSASVRKTREAGV